MVLWLAQLFQHKKKAQFFPLQIGEGPFTLKLYCWWQPEIRWFGQLREGKVVEIPLFTAGLITIQTAGGWWFLGISGWTINSMKGATYRLNIRDFWVVSRTPPLWHPQKNWEDRKEWAVVGTGTSTHWWWRGEKTHDLGIGSFTCRCAAGYPGSHLPLFVVCWIYIGPMVSRDISFNAVFPTPFYQQLKCPSRV